ncbi:hypothetical protein BLNAU_10802 [Blattamonas nauphoetae]|uniref:RRM domain-containing protein n=1 Tax=Blattamonas nauphoetae TaxID=2049346 RepID=A0ABQ9XRW6_9EUKA|nr:hypothetical protein BLNAU_10802 [Blattamonas nauphoetae]
MSLVIQDPVLADDGLKPDQILTLTLTMLQKGISSLPQLLTKLSSSQRHFCSSCHQKCLSHRDLIDENQALADQQNIPHPSSSPSYSSKIPPLSHISRKSEITFASENTPTPHSIADPQTLSNAHIPQPKPPLHPSFINTLSLKVLSSQLIVENVPLGISNNHIHALLEKDGCRLVTTVNILARQQWILTFESPLQCLRATTNLNTLWSLDPSVEVGFRLSRTKTLVIPRPDCEYSVEMFDQAVFLRSRMRANSNTKRKEKVSFKMESDSSEVEESSEDSSLLNSDDDDSDFDDSDDFTEEEEEEEEEESESPGRKEQEVLLEEEKGQEVSEYEELHKVRPPVFPKSQPYHKIPSFGEPDPYLWKDPDENKKKKEAEPVIVAQEKEEEKEEEEEEESDDSDGVSDESPIEFVAPKKEQKNKPLNQESKTLHELYKERMEKKEKRKRRRQRLARGKPVSSDSEDDSDDKFWLKDTNVTSQPENDNSHVFSESQPEPAPRWDRSILVTGLPVDYEIDSIKTIFRGFACSVRERKRRASKEFRVEVKNWYEVEDAVKLTNSHWTEHNDVKVFRFDDEFSVVELDRSQLTPRPAPVRSQKWKEKVNSKLSATPIDQTAKQAPNKKDRSDETTTEPKPSPPNQTENTAQVSNTPSNSVTPAKPVEDPPIHQLVIQDIPPDRGKGSVKKALGETKHKSITMQQTPTGPSYVVSFSSEEECDLAERNLEPVWALSPSVTVHRAINGKEILVVSRFFTSERPVTSSDTKSGNNSSQPVPRWKEKAMKRDEADTKEEYPSLDKTPTTHVSSPPPVEPTPPPRYPPIPPSSNQLIIAHLPSEMKYGDLVQKFVEYQPVQLILRQHKSKLGTVSVTFRSETVLRDVVEHLDAILEIGPKMKVSYGVDEVESDDFEETEPDSHREGHEGDIATEFRQLEDCQKQPTEVIQEEKADLAEVPQTELSQPTQSLINVPSTLVTPSNHRQTKDTIKPDPDQKLQEPLPSQPNKTENTVNASNDPSITVTQTQPVEASPIHQLLVRRIPSDRGKTSVKKAFSETKPQSISIDLTQKTQSFIVAFSSKQECDDAEQHLDLVWKIGPDVTVHRALDGKEVAPIIRPTAQASIESNEDAAREGEGREKTQTGSPQELQPDDQFMNPSSHQLLISHVPISVTSNQLVNIFVGVKVTNCELVERKDRSTWIVSFKNPLQCNIATKYLHGVFELDPCVEVSFYKPNALPVPIPRSLFDQAHAPTSPQSLISRPQPTNQPNTSVGYPFIRPYDELHLIGVPSSIDTEQIKALFGENAPKTVKTRSGSMGTHRILTFSSELQCNRAAENLEGIWALSPNIEVGFVNCGQSFTIHPPSHPSFNQLLLSHLPSHVTREDLINIFSGSKMSNCDPVEVKETSKWILTFENVPECNFAAGKVKTVWAMFPDVEVSFYKRKKPPVLIPRPPNLEAESAAFATQDVGYPGFLSSNRLVLFNVPSSIDSTHLKSAFVEFPQQIDDSTTPSGTPLRIVTFSSQLKCSLAAQNLRAVWDLDPALEVYYTKNGKILIPINRPENLSTPTSSLYSQSDFSSEEDLSTSSSPSSRHSSQSDITSEDELSPPSYPTDRFEINGDTGEHLQYPNQLPSDELVLYNVPETISSDQIKTALGPYAPRNCQRSPKVNRHIRILTYSSEELCNEAADHLEGVWELDPRIEVIFVGREDTLISIRRPPPQPSHLQHFESSPSTQSSSGRKNISSEIPPNLWASRFLISNVPEHVTRTQLEAIFHPIGSECFRSTSNNGRSEWFANFGKVEICNAATANLTKLWELHPSLEVAFFRPRYLPIPIPRPHSVHPPPPLVVAQPSPISTNTPSPSPTTSALTNCYQLLLSNVPTSLTAREVRATFDGIDPYQCSTSGNSRTSWIVTFETVEKCYKAAKTLTKVWALHPKIEVGFRVDRSTIIPIPRPDTKPISGGLISSYSPTPQNAVKEAPVQPSSQPTQQTVRSDPLSIESPFTTANNPNNTYTCILIHDIDPTITGKQIWVVFEGIDCIAVSPGYSSHPWKSWVCVFRNVAECNKAVTRLQQIIFLDSSATFSFKKRAVSILQHSVEQESIKENSSSVMNTQQSVTAQSTTSVKTGTSPLSVTPSSNTVYDQLVFENIPRGISGRHLTSALSPHPYQCSSVNNIGRVQWIATFETVAKCNKAAMNLTKVWALHPKTEVGFRVDKYTSIPLPRPSHKQPSPAQQSTSPDGSVVAQQLTPPSTTPPPPPKLKHPPNDSQSSGGQRTKEEELPAPSNDAQKPNQQVPSETRKDEHVLFLTNISDEVSNTDLLWLLGDMKGMRIEERNRKGGKREALVHFMEKKDLELGMKSTRSKTIGWTTFQIVDSSAIWGSPSDGDIVISKIVSNETHTSTPSSDTTSPQPSPQKTEPVNQPTQPSVIPQLTAQNPTVTPKDDLSDFDWRPKTVTATSVSTGSTQQLQTPSLSPPSNCTQLLVENVPNQTTGKQLTEALMLPPKGLSSTKRSGKTAWIVTFNNVAECTRVVSNLTKVWAIHRDIKVGFRTSGGETHPITRPKTAPAHPKATEQPAANSQSLQKPDTSTKSSSTTQTTPKQQSLNSTPTSLAPQSLSNTASSSPQSIARPTPKQAQQVVQPAFLNKKPNTKGLFDDDSDDFDALPDSSPVSFQLKPSTIPKQQKKVEHPSSMTLKYIPNAIESQTLLRCFHPFVPRLTRKVEEGMIWGDWTASFASGTECEQAKSVVSNVLDFGKNVVVVCGKLKLEKMEKKSEWFKIVIEGVPVDASGIEIRGGLKGVGEIDTTLLHLTPHERLQPSQRPTGTWSVCFEKREDLEVVMKGKNEIVLNNVKWKVKKHTTVRIPRPSGTIVIVNYPDLTRR